MRSTLLSLLLVPALVPACTDEGGVVTTTDTPITAAVQGDTVVIAANEATEATGFGCGGGQAQLGRSVLFVSSDRGATFDRVVPSDERPLVRIAAHDGVFYGVAHGNDGSFGVVTSADGASWTEVAGAPRYAQDLAAGNDMLVVAHSTGVLTSADGSAWTQHEVTDSFYQASIARIGGQLALGTNIDGKLRLSSNGDGWTEWSLQGLTSIAQVIPAGDRVYAVGWGQDGQAIATVDLAHPETATVAKLATFVDRALLTPAGLLSATGELTPITATGTFGTGIQHVNYFSASAIDGNTVVVARPDSVSISTDGGTTFGAPTQLPVIRVEAPATEFEPRG